jgi:hypothetical protein
MHWQADFYRRPLQDASGNPIWELVVCDAEGKFTASAFCSQSEADSNWIAAQLQQWILQEKPDSPEGGTAPLCLQVFRPQSVSLILAAAEKLGITVEQTRSTPALKQLLIQKATEYHTLPSYTNQPYDPVTLDRPAPLPLPENLWGDRWRFAAISAGDIVSALIDRPIPIREMPEALFPIHLQLPSTLPVPGVIIDGGRQSMNLARWLQRSRPVFLHSIPGQPDGLILEAGLVERWVLTTFEDPDVVQAAKTFRDRQAQAKGLHFLLVQPDDSGMTYTGFWLLQSELPSQ